MELIDQYLRKVNYLRVSVTDRCDLRCKYCMPQKMKFTQKEDSLSIVKIVIVEISIKNRIRYLSIFSFLIKRINGIKIDINFMNVDLSLVKKITNIKKNIKHIRKKFFFELPKKNKIDDRPRPIINVPALNSSPINPETLIFLYLVSIPKIFCLKIN